MEDKNHTELPWHIVIQSVAIAIKDSAQRTIGYVPNTVKKYIASQPNEANAEFIVRACNSHYELLNGLKRIHNILQSDEWMSGDAEDLMKRMADIADEAIAKAEGQ